MRISFGEFYPEKNQVFRMAAYFHHLGWNFPLLRLLKDPFLRILIADCALLRWLGNNKLCDLIRGAPSDNGHEEMISSQRIFQDLFNQTGPKEPGTKQYLAVLEIGNAKFTHQLAVCWYFWWMWWSLLRLRYRMWRYTQLQNSMRQVIRKGGCMALCLCFSWPLGRCCPTFCHRHRIWSTWRLGRLSWIYRCFWASFYFYIYHGGVGWLLLRLRNEVSNIILIAVSPEEL